MIIVDIAEYTSSYTYTTSQTAASLSLFRSNICIKSHKKSDKQTQDEFLLQGTYCQIGIKDFSFTQANLYKYTWEILVYMVITAKKQKGPDIWPETLNMYINTKNMIITIWFKKTLHCR